MNLRRLVVALAVAALGIVPEAVAGLSSCATDWANFSGSDGFIRGYTYLGEEIRDHEQAGDPSNGGTGVNPDWIDVSSASPDSPPGPQSSVAFGYWNGGTVWDANDPVTMEDDYVFFRMRLGDDPRESSGVGFDSFHWNVLFDLNTDGYKDYWIDTEGPYDSRGNNDRVQILYDPAHTQLISSADVARVEQFAARGGTDAGNCAGRGYSHTRTYAVGDGSGDWFLEIQVPLTAFNDHSGNQLVYPDSPVSFVYTTGASNQDPLQKDHMMDLSYVTSTDPIQFGDVVTPSGLPLIDFTNDDLTSASYYMLGGDTFVSVTDFLANQDPTLPECITVTVTDPVSGDDEPMQLCETGPSTGTFTNRGGLCAVAIPGSPTVAWLADLRTYTTTFAASWQLVFVAQGKKGSWRVEYSTDGGGSWTALPDHAEEDTPFTAVVLGESQVTFTIGEDGPANGDVISFCATAGQRLPTTDVVGADSDGEMTTADGRTLYVSYTNASHYTVTDSVPVLGSCGALIAFTRSDGRATTDYDITADPSTGDELYVTVTAPTLNTDPGSAETLQITLLSTRPSGDSEVLTLTETGDDTGIFRNSSGLPTVIATASYPITTGNGRWEDIDAGAVSVSLAYTCEGDRTASTTATLFSTPGGGRVEFINGAGTQDVELYTPGTPVWVQVGDITVGATCVTPPYAAGTVRVTITSATGDSETVVLYETVSGSGLYRNQLYDLVTTAGSAVVTSAAADFVALGVQAGDPFAIAVGPDIGLYTVASVDPGGHQATLTQVLGVSRTGIAFNPVPLLSQTDDGASIVDDGVLAGVHDGTFQAQYTDCLDGDTEPSNDVKTDEAVYNAPALVINRVLFAPDSPATCQQELVEIYNQTTGPVTATGFTVRDEDSQLDYTVPQLDGADIVLQPGERVVLSIGGFFTDFTAGGIYYLFTAVNDPVDVLPNWLGGPGDADPADQVTLFSPYGEIADYIGWSGTPTPSLDFLGDDAEAVLADIWQDDAYRSTSTLVVGQTLARASDGVDSDRPDDWTLVADSTCQTIIDAYALTRATVRGLRVDRSGVVEFATGTQQGSLSFRVWGADDARGSGLTPLHEQPLPAIVRDSVTPLLYRVETAPITQPFVMIEEADVRGLRRLMGPFATEDVRLRAHLERIEVHLDRADAREVTGGLRGGTGRAQARVARSLSRSPGSQTTRRSPGPHRRRGPAPTVRARGVKVRVSEPGLVSVPVAELEAHGAPRDVSAVQLSAQGRPVPFRLARGGEALEFWGESLSTDYTGENVYLITWDGRRPTPSVALTRSGDLPWEGYMRVEKSYAYVPSLPREADPWQWDILVTGWGTWPYEWWDPAAGTFDLPVRIPRDGGAIAVALRLVGASPHTHTVEARINGMSLGTVTFEGETSALLTGEIPASLLASSSNELQLDYSADVVDPWVDYGMVYFDHIDFGAALDPRRARARWDIAPWNPRVTARRAEYLIVTHGDFAAAADRIAEAKAAEGLSPVVVDVERAYDAYSGGVPEANAVKALIRDFARHGTRYVLLVGDDTFDTRDYMATGAVSFIPSAIAWDGVWGRIPSENLYADVDDDGRPDVAIGRLPVQTADQANAMAAKIVAQAALVSQSAGRHLMAVDNSSAGDPQFLEEALAVPLPPGATVSWANVGDGVDLARQSLFASLEQGAQVTHYFGHGGPDIWADEYLLGVWDVPALAATKPTVLFTWACQSQWYLNLWGPSLNEALLLLPEGGAVASFGPAGITTPRQQRTLSQRVYSYFLAGGLTLGEAIRWAKADSLAEDPANHVAVEGWNLLGDPALRLSGATGRR